jgi:hypothetical protein
MVIRTRTRTRTGRRHPALVPATPAVLTACLMAPSTAASAGTGPQMAEQVGAAMVNNGFAFWADESGATPGISWVPLVGALDAARTAAALSDEDGDSHSRATAQLALGGVLLTVGRRDEAATALEEALTPGP